MANRKDVAAMAGVSVATVSYVLNHTKRLSPEVEKRVQDAAAKLNYRPNLLAQGLSSKATRHVAMLVDNLYNPHYSELLSGAQAAASQRGYIVSVLSVDQSRPSDILDLTARCVDGVILTLGMDGMSVVRRYLGEKMPIAVMGPYVDIDYQPAMTEMVSRLKALGHEKVAFLSGLPLDGEEHTRLKAWRTAMQVCELEVDPALIVAGTRAGETGEAEGSREMLELLRKGKQFTAVYALNDLMALGAQRMLHIKGFKVPDDVSVIGCDHLRVLRSITPTLATIDGHTFETGRYLMEELLARIAGNECELHIMDAQFVNGESVGPAKRF